MISLYFSNSSILRINPHIPDNVGWMDSDIQSGSKKNLSNKNPAYFFPYIHLKERSRSKDGDGNWNTSIEGNARFINNAIPFENKDDCTRFG